jgi:formate hydrogenlyase subunit 3/multisubunit Na+/H+ antiporter MnhD subunit
MILVLVSLGLFLAGGLAALLAPSATPKTTSALGAGGAIAGSVVGLAGAVEALLGEPTTLRLGWGGFGTLALGTDLLSAFFMLPVLLLVAVAALYGSEYLKRQARPLGAHWFFYDVLAASMLAVLVARDVLSFLVAWEAMALSSFFLVTFEREKASVREAGWIYLVATHLGTAFLLPFFLILGQRANSLEFNAIGMAGFALPTSVAGACFVFAVVGFGTKAGFMPLHVWLPEAHPAAPSHVSAVMSGVMIKTGIYGLMRALSLLGEPAPWWGWVLLAIGVSSGILGVLFALAQHDLKRLLAYHSVENIGIIAIGLGLGVLGITGHHPTMAALGFAGALLHVVNHALFKGLLFLGAGSVLHATGTRELDLLGGLLKRMPATALFFLVGAVAICGLPPLNGFVSELLLYIGAFGASGGTDASAAVAGLVSIASLALIGGLAAACFTKAFGIVFLGEPRGETVEKAHDPGWPMKTSMAILAGLCVLIGIAAPLALSTGAVSQSLGIPPGSLVGASVGAAALWLLIGLAALARRSLLSGRPVASSPTWDCGYAQPTARMQYTASSFADPIVRVFWPFLRTHQEGRSPKGYFPSAASLATETPDLGRERVFAPAFSAARSALGRLRVMQQGGMHLYVLYIALALLVLLLWKL